MTMAAASHWPLIASRTKPYVITPSTSPHYRCVPPFSTHFQCEDSQKTSVAFCAGDKVADRASPDIQNSEIPCSSRFRFKDSQKNSVAFRSGDVVADRVLADIQTSGIIACLRAKSAEVAVEAARAALRGGISVLEITMSTPGVFEALQVLVQEYPSVSIGVGTVLDRADAKEALKIGAKFVMSPAMVKGILEDVFEGQALYIPGATTPTEILHAYNDGAKIIKVYPASALGGVDYIRALKKPFPHIPLVASQGIKLDSVEQYITQGASAVVLSDAVFDKRAMDEQNFCIITELACIAAFKVNEASRKTRDCLS